MELVRFELDNDNWWEVVPHITVGMAKAVANLQTKVANIEEAKAALEAGKDIPTLLDAEGNDLTFQITHEMLYAATKAWSYGLVTREVYDDIELSDYNFMVAKINELYGAFPLP